jgi:hypothetical protein
VDRDTNPKDPGYAAEALPTRTSLSLTKDNHIVSVNFTSL